MINGTESSLFWDLVKYNIKMRVINGLFLETHAHITMYMPGEK